MTTNQRITIDPDILERCAARLAEVSRGPAQTARHSGSAQLGPRAFGLMNSWMVAPISTVSSESSTLIRTLGEVIGSVGMATEGAADDFGRLEETVIAALESIEL